jgi:hypothetical protein
MFIRFFKAKYFIQFATLFFIAVLLWIDILVDPKMLIIEGSSTSYFGLTGLLQKFPVILVIISLLLLIFQAIVLNQVLENHRLMERNQLLTAAVYIVIVSSSPVLTSPFSMLLTNFILILMLNIALNIYGKKEPYREIFDAAFLIGIASILHLPVVLFIFFLWACLVIYQIFTGREWLISIIGISVPVFFAGTYFYLTGQFYSAINDVINIFTHPEPPVFIESIYLYVIWGILAALTFISLGHVSKGLTESTISLRKKFRALVIFFVISVGSAIFAGEKLLLILVISAIPASAFIALYLSKTKKLFIPEIIIIILFISILLGKYFNLS